MPIGVIIDVMAVILGGLVGSAAGLRMLKVRPFPIADMLPAMVLVMPVSFLWTTFLLPLMA